jgi:outer membrane protein assembly factor BamD
VAVLVAVLSACASLKEDEASSADVLYKSGKEALDSGYYENAIKDYEKLQASFPFGDYAQQAQLDIAYAYYKNNEPESAIAAADQFIKTYPRHEHVDYAYYLRGLANFAQSSDYFDKPLHIDAARRDPRSAQESFQYFSELVERFPASRYASDARQRMIFLKNYLARHELYVADYYMRRGAYIAAANRARFILENYPRTPSIPDALELLVRAYTALGLEDLAADARRVLELNTPAEAQAASP